MRWPLRHQIMLPMAATMLLSVVVVGGVGATLAVRGAKARIDNQISQVARILEESNFPLSESVLSQMRALSGAALALVDDGGRIVSASGAADEFAALVGAAGKQNRNHADNQLAGAHSEQGFSLDDRRWVRNQGYFHTVVELSGRRGNASRGSLHIFYPEEEYRRAWQRAVVPSLVFVAVALPVVMLLAAWTAGRIGRRVGRLQGQVDHIAQGDFQQLALPERDDEIRALSQAVNRMAAMLARYEAEVRRTERMRTLAHLGGGIAHQLRNSATGCGIALDLHERECPIGESCESLSVAKRQLRLMEEYLQRFLQLGKPAVRPADDLIDVAALVEDLLPLIEPAARHAGVDLRWLPKTCEATVLGHADRLRQLVINLLINAIEAAAQFKAQSNAPAEVVVELLDGSPGRFVLRVSDTGRGPAEAVQNQLFEPFVTEKPDGVGLGLSVAREVAEEHGGRIDWRRIENRTQFTVELPCDVAIEAVAT